MSEGLDTIMLREVTLSRKSPLITVNKGMYRVRAQRDNKLNGIVWRQR